MNRPLTSSLWIFTMTGVLVAALVPFDPHLSQAAQRLPDAVIVFNKRITDFYTYRTGIGTNILLMTIISFLVGLSISGQTFYSFITENLEKFGALKAIGAKGRDLVEMILGMAIVTAMTGFGLGIGLVTLTISLARARLPNYAAMIGFWNLALALVMVLIIAAISSWFAIRRVLKIEPFDIFRS